MSTLYPGPGQNEFDRDGLPLQKSSNGAQAANPFAVAQEPLHYLQQPQPYAQQASQPHAPVANPAAYPQVPYGQAPYPSAPKSKIVAALLFYFLGMLGAGNFYLHQNNRGFAKLVLYLVGVTALLFRTEMILILAALFLWCLAEVILVLAGAGGYDRDGRGVPLN